MGNNILIKIKRFFQNKNTVTIICVLAGILVLYIGYNWRVGSATEPISIPYAKNTLSSRHTITREDIGYVEVASTVLEKMPNIIRNSAQLIGKEVIYGNTIQMNSFFYSEDITDAEKNIENYAYEIPEGYSPIHLDVDFHSTYGNAMYPGNYIDLWFSDADESGRLIYGKFIKSFQILDVVDSDGNSVFETIVKQTPEQIYLKDAAERLKQILGTNVNIKQGKKKSRIEIEFYNEADLDRLIDLLMKKQQSSSPRVIDFNV